MKSLMDMPPTKEIQKTEAKKNWTNVFEKKNAFQFN